MLRAPSVSCRAAAPPASPLAVAAPGCLRMWQGRPCGRSEHYGPAVSASRVWTATYGDTGAPLEICGSTGGPFEI